MSVCPLCNGLMQVTLTCPRCKGTLSDTGALTNYFDPYSPYLDDTILNQNDGVGSNECLHLFTCPKCHHDYRIKINCCDNKLEFL